jgi:hypothetical protein
MYMWDGEYVMDIFQSDIIKVDEKPKRLALP